MPKRPQPLTRYAHLSKAARRRMTAPASKALAENRRQKRLNAAMEVLKDAGYEVRATSQMEAAS